MTKSEWNYRMDLVTRELAILEASKPCCETCAHYEAPNCARFDAAPPDHIKAEGCPEWKWSQVPF